MFCVPHFEEDALPNPMGRWGTRVSDALMVKGMVPVIPVATQQAPFMAPPSIPLTEAPGSPTKARSKPKVS